MNKMQQLFDTCAGHMLAQKKKSEFDVNGGCMYRSPTGLMCAVGCLIDDDNYSTGIEGNGIHMSSVRKALSMSIGSDITDSEYSLLGALQHIHDQRSVSKWEAEIEKLAKEHELEW